MVVYRFGDHELDVDAFVLRRGVELLPLQPKVLDVLRYLIEHRGNMVAKTELLDQLWPNEHVNEAVVSWSVSHIRRALGQTRADRSPIETVHGRGYRFTAEVSAAAALRPELQARSVPARAPSFVGRERAMTELMQHVRAAASGQGTLCVITGEAGIGKTRCTEELVKVAGALGLRAISGRCPQAPGTPPLWPIATALGQLGGDPSSAAQRARAVIASLGDQELAPPGGTSSADGVRFRKLEELARILRELVTVEPLLLVLDDVHWADVTTLRFIGFIAPELRALPLCIVLALRDQDRKQDSAHDRSLQSLLRRAQTMPLRSLDSAHVAELIAAVGREPPTGELAEAVWRASGGVPLFVHEIARALVREHGEHALPHLRADAVRPSQLALDLLRGRLRALPAATLEVLTRASVLGETFELAVLASLAECAPEALLDRLAPALAEGQVESEAPHVYRFAHALFHAVLYEDLSPALRVSLHRKVAVLLAQRVESDTLRAQIARHYYLSLPAGDHAEVVRRARDAGLAALRALAFDEAALYFGWALEAQTFASLADPRERAQLLLWLATAQRRGGRTGDANETAARVVELAEQHRLHDLIVIATRLRRPTMALASVPDRLVRGALEGVLRQLPDGPEADAVRIPALAQLACVPPYDRELARSKELSAQAVELAERNGDRELRFEALRARLFSLSGPDDIERLIAVADSMLALDSSGPHSWQSMDARVARVAALYQACRISEADLVLSEIAAAIGQASWGEAAFYCQRMRAQRRFLDGFFDEAEQRWKDVYTQATRAGVSYADVMRDAQLLNLELEREGAKHVVERRFRASSSVHKLSRPIRAAMARITAQAGDLELARAHLAALGDPGDYPRDGAYLNMLASFVVCATALDDKPRCEQLVSLLAPYAHLNTPDANGYYLGSVAHFLGLACGVLGESKRAAEHFERALASNRAMGYRAGVVRTLRAHADLELRLGNGAHRAHARALLVEARAHAEAIGMRSALAEADALLAGLS